MMLLLFVGVGVGGGFVVSMMKENEFIYIGEYRKLFETRGQREQSKTKRGIVY